MYPSKKQLKRSYGGIGRKKKKVIKVNEVRRPCSFENVGSQRTWKLLCLSQALAPALDFDSENINKNKRRTFTIENACSSV